MIDVAFKQFLVMPEWMEVRARARDRARVGVRARARARVSLKAHGLPLTVTPSLTPC